MYIYSISNYKDVVIPVHHFFYLRNSVVMLVLLSGIHNYSIIIQEILCT